MSIGIAHIRLCSVILQLSASMGGRQAVNDLKREAERAWDALRIIRMRHCSSRMVTSSCIPPEETCCHYGREKGQSSRLESSMLGKGTCQLAQSTGTLNIAFVLMLSPDAVGHACTQEEIFTWPHHAGHLRRSSHQRYPETCGRGP